MSPTLRSVRRSSELLGLALVNTSNVVLKATVMPEWPTIFEAEDSDFGGAWLPWKCVFPLKWMTQVPRVWEWETADSKPTKADHDQSRQTPLSIPIQFHLPDLSGGLNRSMQHFLK